VLQVRFTGVGEPRILAAYANLAIATIDDDDADSTFGTSLSGEIGASKWISGVTVMLGEPIGEGVQLRQVILLTGVLSERGQELRAIEYGIAFDIDRDELDSCAARGDRIA